MIKRLEIEIKNAHYAFDRYKKISTFALLHHEDNLEVQTLAKYLRVSDKFLKIDEHTYFIKFTFTSIENTFKAAQNLLLALDNYFNERNCYIAIEALDTTNTPNMVVNKLFQILEETRKNSYGRIEDDNILNAIV